MTTSPYKPLPPLAELNPGLQPVEYKVLVLVAELEERSRGGIIIVDDAKDREELAGVEGLLVAVSPMAFKFDEWPQNERAPQPGERVTFAKYAGTIVIGDDGKKYRIMQDKDITGVRRTAVKLAANAA